MIAYKQIEIINLAKNYLKNLKKNKIDTSISSLSWLLNIPCTLSYMVVKNNFLKKKLIFKDYLLSFKFFLNVAYLHNYQILNNFEDKTNLKKKIITWGSLGDFKKNGSFQDRAFSINSKKYKNILWIVIYDGKNIPKKINDNILIFGKKDNNYKYNIFYLIKVLFNSIIESNFSINFFLHTMAFNTVYASKFFNEINSRINLKRFNCTIMAYEAQPFQNNFFKKIKKINSKIETIGYLHSAQPLPLYYLKRDGSPDKLLTHSSDQAYHLKKYLSWSSKSISLIKSLRYKNREFRKFSNTIILPYVISNQNILINQYKNFLEGSNPKSLNNFKIRPHPFAFNIKKSKKFVRDIEQINEKFKSKFSKNKKNLTIVFGGSSAVLLALESGLSVIHFCEDAFLESYTNKLWPSIKIKQISDNMFIYSLIKSNKCINFSKNSKKFNHLLK
tara:strand:+ start:7046 stop:8380 length:1335 start_codon:yes stop_codon:yes gene_type:complete